MGWGIHRSNGSRSVGWTFGWSKEWSFRRKFSRTWSVIISVVFILVWVLFAWLSSGGDHDQRVEDQLDAAINSIVQSDEAQWQALTHPEYGQHLMDLDALKAKWRENNVAVGITWSFNGTIECISETYQGLDAVRATCRIRIGPQKEYSIIAIYIVDEPEGFVEFNVYAV